MILFLSQTKDKCLCDFVNKFSKQTEIKTKLLTIKDIVNNGISIKYNNEKFQSIICSIPFDEVKLCYINSEISFYKELFSFKEELDNIYAEEEWNAALLCLLNSAKNTKFINSNYKKYFCTTELENLLILQKYNLDTSSIFLSNNSKHVLFIDNFFNNQTIIKNIILGYATAKNFSVDIKKKLDKLYRSPYIFQKSLPGQNIIINLIGNEYIAYDGTNQQEIKIPNLIISRLKKLAKDIGVSIISFYAIKQYDKYYFYSFNQMPSFMELLYINKKKTEKILIKYLLKEYNS